MAKLSDHQKNVLSPSITDSISQFIEGYFIEGSEKIKEVNEIIKDKLLNT